MNTLHKRIAIIIITLALLVIPTIFWGHLYLVGGDDSRLYYIFPREMIAHFIQNIVSNNTLGVNGGYGSQIFFVPFLLLISALKVLIPFLNTQFILYGMNFAFGFIFFYCFLGLWVDDKKNSIFILLAKIASSLFYLFSYFMLKTVLNHQLVAIYVVSVFPAVMYLFMKSLNEKKAYIAVLSAVVYSGFSITLLTLPWFGAMVFTCIPIGIVWIIKYPKVFIRHSVIFVSVFICLNFYWLFHLLYQVFYRGGNGIFQTVTSNAFRANNINFIWTLSHLNPPIHQIAAYIRTAWADRNNLMFSQSFGLIYIFTILLAGVMLPKGNRKYGRLYILSVIGLLFGFILIAPDFGDWNVNLFIFFNNHIPSFTMFRNMYDKFGPAVSFQFGFALCISLIIIGKRIRSAVTKSIIIFFLVGVTIINSWSYLFSDKSSVGISGVFSDDYKGLISYVSSMNEASRFVWLPLNFPSYSVIEDAKNPGHFYYGVSPLQFLAQASDYTGFQSFATTADPDQNNKLLGLIPEQKYDEIGRILQRMNAKYIITYHYNNIPKPYYDHMNFEDYLVMQKPEMFDALRGRKIRDFGSRYTLYTINDKYRSEKIFLTDSFNEFPDIFTGLTYKNISPTQFDIIVQKPSGTIHLAFLEPFDALWELTAVDSHGKNYPIPDLKHTMVYRYGNGWTFQSHSLDNLVDNGVLHLRISFRAQQYTDVANRISLFSWIVSVLYIAVVRKKEHGKN